MFEIFMMIGWTLVGILLLYLWADVRELKREIKSCRRDVMRNSLGGRTSEGYPGFSEEAYWREARQEQEREIKPEPAKEEEKKEKKKTLSLKPGEEQVLREILMEFLS